MYVYIWLLRLHDAYYILVEVVSMDLAFGVTDIWDITLDYMLRMCMHKKFYVGLLQIRIQNIWITESKSTCAYNE